MAFYFHKCILLQKGTGIPIFRNKGLQKMTQYITHQVWNRENIQDA